MIEKRILFQILSHPPCFLISIHFRLFYLPNNIVPFLVNKLYFRKEVVQDEIVKVLWSEQVVVDQLRCKLAKIFIFVMLLLIQYKAVVKIDYFVQVLVPIWTLSTFVLDPDCVSSTNIRVEYTVILQLNYSFDQTTQVVQNLFVPILP